jgi:hypothetical protein
MISRQSDVDGPLLGVQASVTTFIILYFISFCHVLQNIRSLHFIKFV